MKVASLLLVLLSLPSAAAEKTLWLVRPLYPGQEALAGRTEQALDKLTPPEQRGNQIIGHKELVAALKYKKADDLPCFQGDTRCADPIDPFVATLGFDRVVLIQGGQDETGFKFKVVSYEPATGKTTPASASDSSLDNALLGAVAKVVPITSTLDVVTTPPGATVFIDERKIGVTPVSNAQVLPGERVMRIDLKLHQGIEETVVVPMRGSVKVDKRLEKVAARIIITAQPAGTSISVDGQVLGKDKVDRGIQPGTHTIRLTAENYKAFEQTIQVKADDQLILDKTLEPIAGAVGKETVVIVKPPFQPPPQPPPPPLSLQDQLYERKSYFYVGFAYDFIRGNKMVGRRFGTDGIGRSEFITSGTTRLLGGTGEFGFFGRYFGLAAIGASVFTNEGKWSMSFGHSSDSTGPEMAMGAPLPNGYGDPLETRVVIAHIRAIHPQFRLQLWRFMLNLQAGFELRAGHIWEPNSPAYYKDGFLILDVLVSARAGARFYIVDGFFLYGNYQISFYITGDRTFDGVRSSPTSGFSGGLGYAF